MNTAPPHTVAGHPVPVAVLCDARFARTLDDWVARFCDPRWRGTFVEGWLFESAPARRNAERQLARAGVHARLHSAYKPLLHHVIEQVDTQGLAHMHITCPTPRHGPARRFALEAYPLARLLPEGAVTLATRADNDPWYELQLQWQDGRAHRERIFAPNRVHSDATGAPTLSPTGWLRIGTRAGAADLVDAREATDCEQAFEHAVHCIAAHAWPAQEPYFEQLQIDLHLPAGELALPWAGETVSLLEAMHEELYFSLLEHFQKRSGRAPGDRRLQPGQIVPQVHGGAAQPHMRVQTVRFDAPAQDAQNHSSWHAATDGQPLDTLDRPPSPQRIAALLQSWGGMHFGAPTRQGRRVAGLYHAGSDHPVLISGGQHANETSGVVGALRAAQALRSTSGAHFALMPLENPDGYALHHQLCRKHPHHMHHAARYSALGDDIEYRETPPLLERLARQQALALSGAQLHVNLHGYPAHEWTRPLSGYVPRGFEAWMLPKGFFLILRCHGGWQARGRSLLLQVCERLHALLPALQDFNARQRALYERHAGPLPFEVIAGIACMQVQTAHDAPVTLISEFPDETVDGEDFVFAHTVQMHTVLAAVQVWQKVMAANPSSA
ncbi:M14 family metallopeptidase [Comamonas faecalis]|uniref:M14 family metallopeptidase n=1 Tax=Comamonas faecalis TaxID=1387849 RepID=A0ABP7RH78_9BURK